MPTNRTRRTRHRVEPRITIDESIRTFLLTGEAEAGTPGHELKVESYFYDDSGLIRAAWAQHGPALLKTWKLKRRPWAETFLKKIDNDKIVK